MKAMRIALLLLAGSFFLSGCGSRVERGVRVNGINVGGMTYLEACEKIRAEMKRIPLAVKTPAGEFELQVDYGDDVEEIVRQAKRGQSYVAETRRESVFLEDFADMVCAKNLVEPQDAALSFSSGGFCYQPEKTGFCIDRGELVETVSRALKGDTERAEIAGKTLKPAVTEETLKERTQLLSVFTTVFSPANAPRAHNIALAAEKISGTAIGPGETFSFNDRVGKRTEENGFEIAAVIEGGEFVRGVGGGVCQTSTTLFGAALRAGLEIAESRPHSLAVEYAEPSQDAMVSEYSDLKLKNPYPFPVYLLATAGEGEVSFSVYGKPDGRRYEVESRVLFTLDPPPAKIVDGTENRVLRAPRRGLASESTLLCYEGETLVFRRVIRRDTYACVQGVEERIPAAEDILEDESADF